MNRKRKIFPYSLVLAVLLTVLVTTEAWAITIIVDGTRESAWNGGGSQADGDEATSQRYDLQAVEWTNDDTNFYFLFNTFGSPTTWNNPTGTDPSLVICMNVDNSTLTGTSLTECWGTGYDRFVIIEGPSLLVTVFDENFVPITATTSIATAANITELSIDLASLGLNTTNCGPSGTIPTTVHFDGVTTTPDNIGDAADFPMSCGTPTAITLTNLAARSNANTTFVSIAAILILTVAFILIRRSRKHVFSTDRDE